MPNPIFRERLINNIRYAVSEARDAIRLNHPGLVGRVRELAAERILGPILPASVEIGTGKITNNSGAVSGEVDLVIYNKRLLPAVMYSAREGVFPIESTHYIIEVKSQSTAANLQDAVRKAREVAALGTSPGVSTEPANVSGRRFVSVFFSFGSDLSGHGKTELQRYGELDATWETNPAVQAICVVGRGYWALFKDGWKYLRATDNFDEVLILLAQVTNTLQSMRVAALLKAPRFGDYLRSDDMSEPA